MSGPPTASKLLSLGHRMIADAAQVGLLFCKLHQAADVCTGDAIQQPYSLESLGFLGLCSLMRL